MIRFCDLREADIAGGRFAFFDTVTNRFIELEDEQAFETWEDVLDCSKGEEAFVDRLEQLCPVWVYDPEDY